MKKLAPWLVALLLVVAAAIALWRYRTAHAAPPVQYRTQQVQKRRVVGRVTATGTLQAVVTVQVGSQVSGRLQRITVDFNSPVKKGDLLATIDPQLFQAALSQAQANHLAARANVVKAEAQALDAERQYRRAQALAAQSLASTSEVELAETNLAVAKAGIDVAKGSLAQAQAALQQAQINLSYTKIHSPIDGIVISRNVDVGQTVAASLQAPVLFTIAEDLRKMQVNTNVAEGDVGRLEQKMKASFSVDAFPGQRFRGFIGEIRNAPQTVQNVVTYDAVINVDNGDLKLRPGMTANVTIVYAEKADVIAVANAALRFKPPPEAGLVDIAASTSTSAGTRSGGPHGDAPRDKRSVWVLRGSKPDSLSLQLGLSDGTFSEVVGGDLRVGDEVVVEATVSGKPAAGAGGGAPGAAPGMRRMF